MADYQIDSLEFLTLDGPIGRRTEQLEIVQRPGVPDQGLWRTNLRGKPFELLSQVDCLSLADAHTTYAEEYVLLIGADPVNVIQGGVDFGTTEDLAFAVLDCQLVEARHILTAVGGLNPPSEGFLICRWTLLALPK